MSKDPIGFSGGDGNLYRYVGSDPVNWIDSDGEFGVPPGLSPPIFYPLPQRPFPVPGTIKKRPPFAKGIDLWFKGGEIDRELEQLELNPTPDNLKNIERLKKKKIKAVDDFFLDLLDNRDPRTCT